MNVKLQTLALSLAGGAVLAAGGYYVFLRAAPSPQAEERPTQPPGEPGVLRFAPGAMQLSSLRMQAAVQAPLPLAEPLNGRVAYNENLTARVSSAVSGRVLSLRAQPGDAVKAGDTLLVLDSPDYAAAVSDLRKAEAEEQRKRQALERARLLFEGQVIARKELEAAEADANQAQAESQRARARLANLRADGKGNEAGQLPLRAPIGGIIADRQINPGSEVQPGQANPLFVITDLSRLWVLVDLPERNLSKVKVGLPVTVEVDAYPGEQFPATIERVGEVVDAVTRRIQLRCVVNNPDRRLKPEMYARVTLLADRTHTAVRLPNSSLVTEGLFSFVFVETGAGEFTRRKVTMLVQDREYTYIGEGVQPGDRVVTTGALLLNSELSAGN